MNLHEDKDAFRVLIEQIHLRTGYREDVLEKDYYVVLILEELAEKQKKGLPAYFKGGTALYKALKATKRFSEDIDISVDSRDCTRSQNEKRLEQAAKKYSVLNRNVAAGKTNRSEVISIFTYDPITVFDENDALQRFGKLKIEATSFTISEPVESLEISPMIYDLANRSEQTILKEKYGVRPFPIMTITIERIFIDKLFAAEAYFRRAEQPRYAFEVAKHIYDLAVMIRQPVIQKFLTNEELIKRLLDIRIKEETERLDGIPGVKPIEFFFWENAARNAEIKKAYGIMQAQYVLRSEDRIEFQTVVNALSEIREKLMKCKAWTLYSPEENVWDGRAQKDNGAR